MIADTPSTTVECPTGEPPALQWWDHQRRWLKDRSRLRVCCKARQIGMPTADHRNRDHFAAFREFDLARDGRVAIEREMRAGFVIICEVRGQDAPEMLLVENDETIKALATDRSDDSLDIR